MIADMIKNKELNSIVTELIISLVFITQSYFRVPKDMRLKSTHFLIMKILNKREPLNHSSVIEFKDFIKIYKKCNTEPCSFLVNGPMLASDNPL